MAAISVGEGKNGRRALTHELPLMPFVDFMVCLIAFLIVTAVYTQLSRINATAQVPRGAEAATTDPPQELHVTASSTGFDLRWQRGQTVLESSHVARVPVRVGEEQRYPALTLAITQEWQTHGQHRAESDQRLDQAVLHVQSDLPFSEIVAVLDSLHAPRGGRAHAFEVAFSSN